MPPRILGAIVLAAGESRRMGVQKLLLPFAGQSVIEHVIEQVRAGGIKDILVVHGHDRDSIAPRIESLSIRETNNDRYREGMLSSVRAGLRAAKIDAADPEWQGALIVLGDQPAIQPQVVRSVREAFDDPQARIVIPTFDDRRGHPIAIDMAFREEILTDFDDLGLRGLMLRHPNAIREVPVATESILRDMDYPEDYRRELRKLGERD